LDQEREIQWWRKDRQKTRYTFALTHERKPRKTRENMPLPLLETLVAV